MEIKIKTQLTVAGYIFNSDFSKMLLIHHKKLDLWLPVGGHIEENEVPDEALLREIKEEVGLGVDILIKPDLPLLGNAKRILALPFHTNVHSVGDHDHYGLFYLCKAKNANKLNINSELKNFSWFSKEDLNQKHVPLDVRQIGLIAFEVVEKL